VAQRILHAFYMQSTCSRSENKAIASAYEVVWFLDRLLVCYYSGPCKSTRPWLVSLRCEVACLCYITETIICRVYEHSVQSRWLLDVVPWEQLYFNGCIYTLIRFVDWFQWRQKVQPIYPAKVEYCCWIYENSVKEIKRFSFIFTRASVGEPES